MSNFRYEASEHHLIFWVSLWGMYLKLRVRTFRMLMGTGDLLINQADFVLTSILDIQLLNEYA
jgi:hypothetical protein